MHQKLLTLLKIWHKSLLILLKPFDILVVSAVVLYILRIETVTPLLSLHATIVVTNGGSARERVIILRK